MQRISETIAQQLDRFGICITHKLASSLRAALSHDTDPVPKEQQTNVIYRIPCATRSCAYVGYTGRRLGTRINEHKLAIRRRDPLSLVFAHAIDCDHRFNREGTEVVAMASTNQALNSSKLGPRHKQYQPPRRCGCAMRSSAGTVH
ncbi:unnamed protein product [Schistocephalus solidus]|uniref:GIY-YIG domain-containing protein n=1 Tax=Schistocephalus solidus TaxID=70667 RepID=A0A183TF52_SCHSO|nr:unnamed protein product [Schistocephalus solidus]